MRIVVPEKAVAVCRALRDAGFEAWLVGGAVRDSIIGREPHDWDIATNAVPEQVCALFPKVIETGLAHGTVTVVLDSDHFEVTTYRADGAYSDGRHPDSVQFVSNLGDDLARRDFTINALAYDPINDAFADPFGGVNDIAQGTIVAVGKASDRFSEDSLRMLRAVRFAAVLGFRICPETMGAIREGTLAAAAERIHDELMKGLLSSSPDRFLELLLDSGLLATILPEMLSMRACSQNKYHEFDVWGHTLWVLVATPNNAHLRLAAMFHDVAKPIVKGKHPVTGEATFYNHEQIGAEMTDSIMSRLKFSNEDRQRVVHLVRNHLVPNLESSASIRRWVRKIGRENVDAVLTLAYADALGKGIPGSFRHNAEYLNKLREKIAALEIAAPIVTKESQLAINGRDVMEAMGIGPGPAVGAKLRELMEAVLDDPSLNTRENLIGLIEVS